MKRFVRTALATISLASWSAMAQSPPGAPPHPDIASILQVDAATAAKVDAILQASREKARAALEQIRTDTDKQLSEVLTPEQLQVLRDAMRRGPRGRMGPPPPQ